jgi:DNA primase
MSLPPGFLDELRSRASISQVVGRKVMWDTRKSNQGKGDMWAPCPFHQEKTASFHVDDQKGYYYCFGCQAKGDALGFIKETENVSFMEAVEILAGEVGMTMPERDPAGAAKSRSQDAIGRGHGTGAAIFSIAAEHLSRGRCAGLFESSRFVTAGTGAF